MRSGLITLDVTAGACIGERSSGPALMPRFEQSRKLLVDALSGPRIVFHHVPKCGGTSVAQALRVRYAISFGGFPTRPTYRAVEALHPEEDEMGATKLVDEFQHYSLLFYLYKDVRCVAGHVRFSSTAYEKFSDSYKFVTTLRDPIKLIESAFFYETKRTNHLWEVPKNIEAYIERPQAQLLGASYSYFFSGLPANSEPQSTESIELAKANLKLFDAVGFVDDMSSFQEQLRRNCGLRLRIGHANKSGASSAERSVITPAVRKKIEKLCAANLEIYEFAKNELSK